VSVLVMEDVPDAASDSQREQADGNQRTQSNYASATLQELRPDRAGDQRGSGFHFVFMPFSPDRGKR